MAEQRIRPFSHMSQDADWMGRNCYRCQKFPDARSCTCEIYDALTVAYFTDGTIASDIATRMGYPGATGAYPWDCPEPVSF
jgi:hypothetical protein